ncbi:hypothetical protein B0H11DRAFT_2246470 [Mycena galericulata]|nr:hypothetical protein B0H11DRAFT_2246470 [Mycena galericulata]
MASSADTAVDPPQSRTIHPLSPTVLHAPLDTSTASLAPHSTPSSSVREIRSQSSATALDQLTEITTSKRALPAHWTKFTHMHGGIYYSYGDHQLLTKEDMCDRATRKLVMAAYEDYGDYFKDVPEDAEMVVFLAEGEPRLHFASWSRGMMYGFEEDEEGLVSMGSSSFWDHAWSFPMHRTYMPPFMETQFLTALAFGSNQRVMDVKNTTFPFDDAQIERLMRVYRDLRGNTHYPVPPALLPALCYHIGCVMFEIETARSRYGYGTTWARMYRDVAIPESTWTLLISDLILGIILCGTHKSYRTRLYSTAPKGFISIPDFRRLMRNFMSEWADSNLVATVLVSVNVGFLAVPDISKLARSFSLVSSLCAMTSIITGLHHVWQHREKTETEINDARQYLYHTKLRCRRRPKNYQLTTMDLSPTACLLALPLATLQWSVLSFTLGISVYAFQQSTPSSVLGVRILLLILLPLLGALSCGVFLYFWRIWLPPASHREIEEGEFDPNLAVPPLLPHWEVLKERIAGTKVWRKMKGSREASVRVLRMDKMLRRGRESV